MNTVGNGARRSGSGGGIMAKGGKDDEGPKDAPASRYDEALLSANWNPVIDLLEASCKRTAGEAPGARRELREEDVDAFLGRIYEAGS
jgi:hypothetical protein